MATDLTRGFELVAELSEAVCERILQMAYLADLPGGIPDYVSAQSELDSTDLVEVYFDPPRLEFVAIGDLQSAVKVSFSFAARVFPENVEVHGGIDVLMAATTSVQTDGTTVIALDFADGPGQFGVSGENLPLIESRVKALLIKTVFLRLKARPISPPLSPDVGFFTFRSYVFPSDPGPRPDPPIRLLAIFINRQNAPAAPPNDVEPWVWRTIASTPRRHAVGSPSRSRAA